MWCIIKSIHYRVNQLDQRVLLITEYIKKEEFKLKCITLQHFS